MSKDNFLNTHLTDAQRAQGSVAKLLYQDGVEQRLPPHMILVIGVKPEFSTLTIDNLSGQYDLVVTIGPMSGEKEKYTISPDGPDNPLIIRQVWECEYLEVANISNDPATGLFQFRYGY